MQAGGRLPRSAQDEMLSPPIAPLEARVHVESGLLCSPARSTRLPVQALRDALDTGFAAAVSAATLAATLTGGTDESSSGSSPTRECPDGLPRCTGGRFRQPLQGRHQVSGPNSLSELNGDSG